KIFVGLNLWETYPELIGTPVEQAYRRVARDGVSIEFESYDLPSKCWFEFRVCPATEQGISVFFRDVTERKRSAEKLLELQAQLDTQATEVRRLEELNFALVREKAERDLRDRNRSTDPVRDLKLALETQVADLRNLQELNRLNEERFRMAACGDAITLYEQDADLRYTWLYPPHPEHAGSLGRTDSEIQDGPEGELLDSWKREVMRTGLPQRREITTSLKRGARCYDMSIVARRDHARRIIGVAGAALDITARNYAENQSRQLAAIVECSEDAIISEDLQGTVTSWNKAAERIFGYTADEMVGKCISMLVSTHNTGEQPELMAKVLKGERVDCFETLRRRKDGKTIEVSISVSPIRNDSQTIVGASKIVRDISERKRRETQERAIYELAMRVNRAADISDIFEAAVDAVKRSQSADRSSVLVYDDQGVMRFKSSRGLSAEYQRAVEGHSPWKIEDPDPQPVCIDDVASVPLDDHLRRVINQEGIRALAFIPITYEGKLVGKFMVYYNSPHKFTASELRPAQTMATQVAFAIQRQKTEQKLERLVHERTASLREAIQQMEEFSYTISHDLRAPLRAMQVYSQALLEDFSDALSAEGVGYLKRLSLNATRLDKMILDVLSFSRIARGDHTMERVALDKLVRDIVQHYPEMQAPRAELAIDYLSDVTGHEPSLTQVISNLLSNAVKFVPAGVKPEVKVWTEPRGGHVRLHVRDNGIGIPPQYQHRLFNMFERVHPDLPYEGTGVGLAIVRKAVERMNGTLGVQSAPGTGSTFWIELPAITLKA
ncbi:MAG: PAS domain S-box protein, partial [Limisphaerales bacterium]